MGISTSNYQMEEGHVEMDQHARKDMYILARIDYNM
jgi:hypothetical protein